MQPKRPERICCFVLKKRAYVPYGSLTSRLSQASRSIACEVVLTTLAPKLLLLTQPDAHRHPSKKVLPHEKLCKTFLVMHWSAPPAIAPNLCKTAVQDDLPIVLMPFCQLQTSCSWPFNVFCQSELLTTDQKYKTVAQKQGVSEVSRLFRKPKTFELFYIDNIQN